MRYAAIVSSSILSTRPTVSPTTNVVAKTTTRSMTLSTVKMHDNSVNCCCRKGKCRERPGVSSYEDYFRVIRGMSCMDEQTSGPKTMPFACHGHLRRVRRMFANIITHPDVFRTSPSYTMFSRSVASAASIPKRQTGASQNSHLAKFRDSNFPQTHSDLQGLWTDFSALIEEGNLEQLDARELITLGGMIMRGTLARRSVKTDYVEWGDRLESVVLELKRRSPHISEASPRLDCLAITAQALRGQCKDASATLSDVFQKQCPLEHIRWILDACKHVLQCLLRQGSPSRALEFYLDNYIVLKRLLSKTTGAESKIRSYLFFFHELCAIFRAIDSPSSFLAKRRSTWDRTRIQSLGVLMIRIYCYDGLAEDALEVYEELKHLGVPVYYFVEHSLVRSLTKARRFEGANNLYVDIAPKAADKAESRSYDSTGLHLFAHQGDVERAEECFDRLLVRGDVTPQDITLIMHASAEQGDTKKVVGLFESFFGKPDDGSDKSGFRKPNEYHYSTVIHAHSVQDDVAGMNQWLGRMLANGLTPDHATYNIVLKGIAQRDDLESVNALLDQMRSDGVQPNINSYTTVITTLARRRDVLGAEAMFKRMIREGIKLDRIAITTLMNAHVEAGTWKGVIRVFDFISESQLKDLRLGVEVFNTLLKAYVLIGAPLDVVLRVYRRMEATKLKPDNHTFALLIMSACDSGRMDIASRLFVEMEGLEKDWTTAVEVTKEVLTIIMSAYLRQGNRGQARVIYEDMQRRGIKTTAYAYATILRSYSDASFDDNMKTAQEFLDSLISQSDEDLDWKQPASGRESSYAFVFAPLINAYTKAINVEMAERLYEEFMEHNEQPTIGILALLMDAYRRAGDIEGVQHIWPQIYDFAVSRTDEVDTLLLPEDKQSKFFRERRRGDLLCIPLSIYIDALSHAGQHDEIAKTWNKLRDSGFQFDSHNWNHLVVALVRAGETARAFEVVEKVILPYQRQSQAILRSRAKHVDSPLLFDDEKVHAEMSDEPFIQKVEKSAQKRPSLLTRMRRRFAGRAGKESDDLAHELQLMQQISPEWNVWRPHAVTMRVLVGVLEQLDSGRLIHPTKPRQVRHESDAGQGGEEIREEEVQEEEEEDEDYEPPSPGEATAARDLLQRILRDYPHTVTTIDEWESYERFKVTRESRRFTRAAKKSLHKSIQE